MRKPRISTGRFGGASWAARQIASILALVSALNPAEDLRGRVVASIATTRGGPEAAAIVVECHDRRGCE